MHEPEETQRLTTIGRALYLARLRRGWERDELAAKATEVAARLAPDLDLTFDYKDVYKLEKERVNIKVDNRRDPLAYVMKALGLGVEVLARAVGLL